MTLAKVKLAKVKQRNERLRQMRVAYEDVIREAIDAGCRKVDVAKAAGVSRPTLDKILNERK
jgi:DNA-binding XRE family transcriptional regulator